MNKIYIGGSVKARDGGIVEGYLVPFTSSEQRDLDGEYFDATTDLHLSDFPVDGLKVLYQHALDKTLKVKALGKVVSSKQDDLGLWVQAQLDLRDEYEKAIYEMAKDGKLGWSSGALPQSVEVDESGKITSWAIIEGSLTPTPAMPYKTIISAKSLVPEASENDAVDDDSAQKQTTNTITNEDRIKMDKEQIIELLDQLMALVKEDEAMMSVEEDDLKQASEEVQKSVSELKPEVVTEERIVALFQEQLKAHEIKRQQRKDSLRKAWESVQPAQPSKASGFTPDSNPQDVQWQNRVSVGENLKYANADAADMAFGAMLGKSSDPEWMRQFIGKANDLIENQNIDYKRRQYLKSVVPYKANEVDGTGNTGYGEEWVATFWANDVWQVARYDTLYDRFVAKGMLVRTLNNAGTATFPSEGSDPVAYNRAESIDVDEEGYPENTLTVSPFGTGNVSVTPPETSIATALTDRLREDSSVDAFAQANYQVTVRMQEVRDELLINGDTDTSASTNINYIDGTPTTQYYLGTNGFRKYSLITASSYSNDADGGLSEAQWNEAVKLLPAKLRWRKANTMLICDPDTHQASLTLPEIKEYMQAVRTGDFSMYQGHDVAPSGFLALANTAGKIDVGTPANNTTGSILALYLPYWGVGYSRNINIETDRDIWSGTTIIVGTMRMGAMTLGNGSSTIVYNVGV